MADEEIWLHEVRTALAAVMLASYILSPLKQVETRECGVKFLLGIFSVVFVANLVDVAISIWRWLALDQGAAAVIIYTFALTI